MSTDLLLILIVMSAGVYIGEYVETSVVVPKRRGEEILVTSLVTLYKVELGLFLYYQIVTLLDQLPPPCSYGFYPRFHGRFS